MKLLYITNLPSPYRIDFFNELSKYCDLTVLFERKKADDRNDEWYGSNFNFKSVFLKSINIGNEASISTEVIKYLKKDYDLIILGGYSSPTSMIASIYMRLHRKKYVLNADGGFINNDENKLFKAVKTYFISSANYWLSSGKETNKYLIYYGAKKERIYNFPFASFKKKDVLKEIVSPREKKQLKSEFNIAYDKVILSIGQFIWRKGFDWMIETYKNLDNNIGIYIIGGSPSKEYLELKNRYNMNNLHFIDFQNKEIIKKWYRLSDLFVFPTREDIWGLVVGEAMAQGLPVITTNKCIAGLELIENDKNGYIVEVDNKDELYKVTMKFFNKKNSEHINMQKNALRYVLNNTIENMAKKQQKIYENIIDGGE